MLIPTKILDYLFLPNHGSSLQLLKVEIGGDGQSSEGVEPSHSHFAGDLNFQRGYEWRLMAEARKRNPSITLGGLAWTWPGHIGAGKNSPWTNVTLSAGYLVDWVRGARDVHNLTIDFLDSDWNERGCVENARGDAILHGFYALVTPFFLSHFSWNPSFVKELRKELDAAGFASTKLVCG